MGHLNVSDQLQGSSQIDIWVRNQKWWWTMILWGIGTLLTNAYIVYKKVNRLEGVDPKQILTKYKFQKDIALFWINPQHYEQNNYALASPATTNSVRGRSTPRSRKRPRDLFESPKAVSALTLKTPTVSTPSTSATFSDTSLHVNGKLNYRLNRTLDHLPRPAENNRQCALHMWSEKMQVESFLLYCDTCKVTLC